MAAAALSKLNTGWSLTKMSLSPTRRPAFDAGVASLTVVTTLSVLFSLNPHDSESLDLTIRIARPCHCSCFSLSLCGKFEHDLVRSSMELAARCRWYAFAPPAKLVEQHCCSTIGAPLAKLVALQYCS